MSSYILKLDKFFLSSSNQVLRVNLNIFELDIGDIDGNDRIVFRFRNDYLI